MPKGGIPDRWEDYTKMGNPMKSDKISTRFISFKVPLKKTLTENKKDVEQFTPQDLMTLCEEKGYRLGLIIDLTFTTRYYSKNDFTDNGVQYEKIPIEGQMVPKKARVEKFAEIVDEFLNKTKDEPGVHCTHGINRTGYSICKYLVDKGHKADEVIELFNTCRGDSIERETYLEHLRTGTLPKGEEVSYVEGEYRAKHWGNNANNTQRDSYNHDRHQGNGYNSHYNRDYNGASHSSRWNDQGNYHRDNRRYDSHHRQDHYNNYYYNDYNPYHYDAHYHGGYHHRQHGYQDTSRDFGGNRSYGGGYQGGYHDAGWNNDDSYYNGGHYTSFHDSQHTQSDGRRKRRHQDDSSEGRQQDKHHPDDERKKSRKDTQSDGKSKPAE